MNAMDAQGDMKKLLSTEDGRRLLKLLSTDGGETMRAAGDALQKGDTKQMQALIAPLLQDPEIEKLIRSLGKNINHG